MDDHDVRFQGAQESLRACLARIAPRYGLTLAAVQTLTEMGRMSHPREGRPICASSSQGEFVSLVVAGVVKIIVHAADGHDIVERLLGPGEPFCLLPRSHDGASSEAVAHSDSTVAVFSHATLRQVVTALPPGNVLILIRQMWRELSLLLREKTLLPTMELRDRLMFELPLLAARFGVPDDEGGGTIIDLRLTHEELGRLVSGSRANVTRRLGDLRRDGVVSQSGQRIILRTPGDRSTDDVLRDARTAPASGTRLGAVSVRRDCPRGRPGRVPIPEGAKVRTAPVRGRKQGVVR